MSSKITKVILDTDPGADDIFALLWLISLSLQGFAEITAITTVGGNVPAESTFWAAHKILKLLNITGIEIGRSTSRIAGNIRDAAHIHGQDGMGNLSDSLPEVTQPDKDIFAQARRADEIIIEQLSQFPGEIDLVAIGPLTNLATAEIKKPGILKQARSIVIMGGAFDCPGNVTPESEFNIAFDPQAAATVFASHEQIVVLPMDVTNQLVLTPAMLTYITKTSTTSKLALFIQQLGQFMFQTNLAHRETKGVEGCLMHDAATIAYLFYPETLWLQRARVEIETVSKFTQGKTLRDRRHFPKTNPNAFIATQVDSTSLLAALLEDLKYLLTSSISPQ